MRSDRATPFRGALCALVIALSAFAACAQAQTYNLRVIHRFSGAPDDGSIPVGPLQFDSAGNLYGTSLEGGAYNVGTIFKIAKDGTGTILHSFVASGDPADGVTIDPATGDLYGADEEDYYGQIYKLAPDGTFTVLHAFTGPDGRAPLGSLIRDQAGNLYGVTEAGGTDDEGTIYKLTPNGTLTTLYVFIGDAYGRNPNSLIRDQAGNLYGTTGYSYPTSYGTVFKLAPDGTLTTLYSFTSGADGSAPANLVGDRAGNLYGTTLGGQPNSGTVFKLAPDGTFTTLYTFTGGADGDLPSALLPVGRNLYGTTLFGGVNYFGVLFKLAPDGTERVLHSFTLRDGIFPWSGLTLKYGRLFGTASASDPRDGAGGGTVFSFGVAKQ